MLIAVIVIAGIALLHKGASSMMKGEAAGQFSTTGMASSATAEKMTARGISTFTPSEQSPAVVLTPNVKLLGVDTADPSVAGIKTTFINGKSAPTGIVQMISQQRHMSGGYK